MTQQATDRGDAATGPGVRRDIMVMTLALTFDNTCPGKEIQGRVFEAEGKVNLKPGGVKQPARSRNLTTEHREAVKEKATPGGGQWCDQGAVGYADNLGGLPDLELCQVGY